MSETATNQGVGIIIVGTGAYPELGDLPDDKLRVLIGFRGPGARNEPLKWDFPGGGVEAGESAADTVSREVFEELQVELGQVSYLDDITHQPPATEESPAPGQASKLETWTSSTYAAAIRRGQPAPSVPPEEAHKCTALKFVTLDELTALEAQGETTTSIGPNLEIIARHLSALEHLQAAS